jgi:hypothetical protein
MMVVPISSNFVSVFSFSVPVCEVIDSHLRRLAVLHKDKKFLRIEATDCIPNYPDKNVPTMLIYKDGNIRRQIVGASAFHSTRKSVTLAAVTQVLIDSGALTADEVENAQSSADYRGSEDEEWEKEKEKEREELEEESEYSSQRKRQYQFFPIS